MRNNRAGSLSHSAMTTCCLPIARSQLVSQEDTKKQEKDMTYCIHLTWKLLKSILQNVYFQWQSTNYADAITSPCECLMHTDPRVFLCTLSLSPGLITECGTFTAWFHTLDWTQETYPLCARSNRGMWHSLWPQSMPVYWRDGHITRQFKYSVLSKVLES